MIVHQLRPDAMTAWRWRVMKSSRVEYCIGVCLASYFIQSSRRIDKIQLLLDLASHSYVPFEQTVHNFSSR